MANEEDDDCRLVVKFAENFWWSKHLFHVPNGGRRNFKEAARFKGLGVRPGIPDFVLALPAGPYAGLYLEMKSRGDRGKRGSPSVEQLEYLERFASVGYCTAQAYGFDAAYAVLLWYTKGAARPKPTAQLNFKFEGPDKKLIANNDIVMRGPRP